MDQVFFSLEEIEKANQLIIFKLFNQSLNLLWLKSLIYDELLLFITDNTS